MKFAFLASILSFLATVSWAQEAQWLEEMVDKEWERSRAEARASFNGLLLYPKEIRDSAFEISRFPEVVLTVDHLEDFGEEDVDAVLDAYPQSTREAMRRLLGHREILAILSEHLVTTALLGEIYQAQASQFVRIVDSLADKSQKLYEDSVVAWGENLQENPAALEQLLQAAKDYDEEFPSDGPNQGSGANEGTAGSNQGTSSLALPPDFQAAMTEWETDTSDSITYQDLDGFPIFSEAFEYYYRPVPDGVEFHVSGLPNPERLEYIFENADRYPDLADRLVAQREGKTNLQDFDRAVDSFVKKRTSTYTADFLKDDGQRARRIRESATFEKRFQESVANAKQGGHVAPQRSDFLKSRATEFPFVHDYTEKAKALKASRPKRAGNAANKEAAKNLKSQVAKQGGNRPGAAKGAQDNRNRPPRDRQAQPSRSTRESLKGLAAQRQKANVSRPRGRNPAIQPRIQQKFRVQKPQFNNSRKLRRGKAYHRNMWQRPNLKNRGGGGGGGVQRLRHNRGAGGGKGLKLRRRK